MAFDWQIFLNEHNVHYVTDGPNCPKGDVAVRCPFCGDDPSEHMAINIDGAGWHCWRNRSHAGKSPVKLIQAILHCSFDQARLLAGHTTNIPSNFLEQVQAQMAPSTITAPRDPLKFPREFKPLEDKPLARPYLRYLINRGYGHPKSLTRNYGLHYCTHGAFGGHIIFPVYFQNQLVSWTGRTITDHGLRYKSLTTTPEKAKEEGTPVAIGPIGHYLLWFDELSKLEGDTICLCEGPFDALRINYLADWYGVRATCFFTNSPSAQQIELLHELLPKYKRRILLLDAEGTLPHQIRIQSNLSELKIELGKLPKGVADPGELETADALFRCLKI